MASSKLGMLLETLNYVHHAGKYNLPQCNRVKSKGSLFGDTLNYSVYVTLKVHILTKF